MSAERPAPPDQAEGAPHPRDVQALFGRAREEAALARIAFGPRPPHAWLFEGPAGVGKATLAYRLARALMTTPMERTREDLSVAATESAVRLLSAQGHPDMTALSPAWDEKRGRYRAEIAIDQVRAACAGLFRTPSMAERRVLLIDALDDLSRGASDALLKTLEEPPTNTVLLLIAHKPVRVSATIRSRCRRLRMGPLSTTDTQAVLETVVGLDPATAEEAASSFPGAPGTAVRRLEARRAAMEARALADALSAGDERRWNEAVTRLMALAGDRVRGRSTLETVGDVLAQAVRTSVRSQDADRGRTGPPLAGMDMAAAADLWRALHAATDRTERLNLDRRGAVTELTELLKRAVAGRTLS